MIPAEFVQKLQTYYGVKYTEVERPIVGEWVTRFHGEGGKLSALFNQVTMDVSKNFGKLPDKALLQEAAVKVKPYDPNALPLRPQLTERPLTDAERDTVVAGLAEIMDMARKGRVGAARERRDPYAD